MPASVPVSIRLDSTVSGELSQHHYRGELYRKGSSVYVRYTELDEEEREIRTIVKLNAQEIKIMRSGQIESEQCFVLHERKRGLYRTRMGVLPLETDTRSMDVEFSEGRYSAAWTYSLYIAEEHAGEFALKLTIQEEHV